MIIEESRSEPASSWVPDRGYANFADFQDLAYRCGVGSFAVQLVANASAKVIAPGLPEDEEYLRELGVSEVLDRDADVAALVHERYPDGVDALLDLVSYAPEGFDTHAAVLKDHGRGATPLSAAGEGPGRHNVSAAPTSDNLERLGRLLEAGILRMPIQHTYGFDRAGGPWVRSALRTPRASAPSR